MGERVRGGRGERAGAHPPHTHPPHPAHNNDNNDNDSALGFYNLLGNVWEWVDSWHRSPKGQQEGGGQGGGGGGGEQLTLKGGSFVDSRDGKTNHKVTAATRMGNTADSGGVNTGFRCARGRGGRRRGSDPAL